MPSKVKKIKKNNQHVRALTAIIVLVTALVVALIVGLNKQANTISKYELLSHLDNQACRYLADRGSDSQVSGGFVLNTDAGKGDAKLTYYCYRGENVSGRTIQGKPIGGYPLGATVSYFSSNKAAEAYANNKLNPLRYWSDDGTVSVQNKNYTFIVTDESEPYFDAYRVRANAVVRVSLPCKTTSPEACDNQAKQLLNQELKGINAL
jgi:phosphate/sulfate permease